MGHRLGFTGPQLVLGCAKVDLCPSKCVWPCISCADRKVLKTLGAEVKNRSMDAYSSIASNTLGGKGLHTGFEEGPLHFTCFCMQEMASPGVVSRFGKFNA